MEDSSKEKKAGRTPGFATTAIHAGQDPSQWKSAAVVPPIVTSTTYKWITPHVNTGFFYGRSGNPSRRVLEDCLAALENAKHAFCFSSGMGCFTTVVKLIGSGDHLLASMDLYGGTIILFNEFVCKMGVQVEYVDFTCKTSIENGIKNNTKMIWFETPTNPTLKVIDIELVVKLARKQPGIIIAMDNTFATPYNQRPLELGVDITMLSLTKYMNGHSDVIMGSCATNDDELAKKLVVAQKGIGAVPSPMDCYLVNRSLKTLAIRLDKHRSNALCVAKWLTQHPAVVEVNHPELPSHPQRDIFFKQCKGHSGVLSFRHNKGRKETEKLLMSFEIFTLGESLGGYESLAGFPCTMSHAAVSPDQKLDMEINSNLIRLSVGLENEEDLIADLEQAFGKVFRE